MSGKRFQAKCGWCNEQYKGSLAAHLHEGCPVQQAVRKAEAYAGRRLNFQEAKAVRDKARKELQMDREFRQGAGA